MNSQYFTHTYANGHSVCYQRLPSGTCYQADTPKPVVKHLESYRKNQHTVRLFYGNRLTGQCWLEEHDVIGRIGRSTGPIKVPLLIPPGEVGGPAILEHCIIRIDSPRKVLYQQHNFHVGEFKLVETKRQRYPWQVLVDQVNHARFKDPRQAQHYIEFMCGKRFKLV